MVWDGLQAAILHGHRRRRRGKPPRGWTSAVPASAGRRPSTPEEFFALWETSPFADTFLGAMAAALVARRGSGKRRGRLPRGQLRRTRLRRPQVRAGQPRGAGHAAAPGSHAWRSARRARPQVGRGRYALGLSADHGVAPVPEARRGRGGSGRPLGDAQRLRTAPTTRSPTPLGPGQHAVRAEYTQFFLSEAARAKSRRDPTGAGARGPPARARRGARVPSPGSSDARRDRPDGSGRGAQPRPRTQWPIRDRAKASLHHRPAGSRRGTTTHGTHRLRSACAARLLRRGVKPGRLPDALLPADLAATLAATVGLACRRRWGRADGAVTRRWNRSACRWMSRHRVPTRADATRARLAARSRRWPGRLACRRRPGGRRNAAGRRGAPLMRRRGCRPSIAGFGDQDVVRDPARRLARAAADRRGHRSRRSRALLARFGDREVQGRRRPAPP